MPPILSAMRRISHFYVSEFIFYINVFLFHYLIIYLAAYIFAILFYLPAFLQAINHHKPQALLPKKLYILPVLQSNARYLNAFSTFSVKVPWRSFQTSLTDSAFWIV